MFVTKRDLGPNQFPKQGVVGGIYPEIKQNENEAKYVHQVLSFRTCGAVPPLCRALLWNGCSVRTVSTCSLAVNAVRMHVLHVEGIWLTEKAV
jgi:hypothetical protein